MEINILGGPLRKSNQTMYEMLDHWVQKVVGRPSTLPNRLVVVWWLCMVLFVIWDRKKINHSTTISYLTIIRLGALEITCRHWHSVHCLMVLYTSRPTHLWTYFFLSRPVEKPKRLDIGRKVAVKFRSHSCSLIGITCVQNEWVRLCLESSRYI